MSRMVIIENYEFFLEGESFLPPSAGPEPKASRTHPHLRGALAHSKGQNSAPQAPGM
jgi:hypothetical protein